MGVCACKLENEKRKKNPSNEEGRKNEINIKENLPNKRQELFTGHMFIPIEVTNKVLKSICKFTIKMNGGNDYYNGTGFFMNINDSKKYVLTNYHIISEKIINENIEVQIYNNKIMKLTLNNRYIKCFPVPKDITVIEIKETDEIYNDIELLDYDTNYTQKGYKIYKNADVFSIEYPYGKGAVSASGRIKDIEDYEFEHTIPTDGGSSGCPIILLNNNFNLMNVIGIHKEADYYKNINRGTFIGEIFKKEYNGIIVENDIKKGSINKDKETLISKAEHGINNKYDKKMKEENFDVENKNNLLNNEINCIYNKQDNEISLLYDYTEHWFSDKYKNYAIECKNNINGKNLEIYLDDKKIEFNYKYKTDKIGKIKVKFKFNQLLTSTFCMFYQCTSLESIDLSSFNSINVNNMYCMFYGCSSLKSINLSSFNTANVKDMGWMFYECSSLESIDLSSFITINVNNMNDMFYGCSSLKTIDLSSFNISNVKYMNYMFFGCRSLKSIDLSSFSITNINNMYGIFNGCSSLRKENVKINNSGNIILNLLNNN